MPTWSPSSTSTACSSAFDVLGLFAFAASGALLAIERGFDVVGIVLLAILTAVGGGIIRDLVLGDTPPDAFDNLWYLLTPVGAAIVAFFAHQLLARGRRAMLIFDAAGLGLFTVTGTLKALAFGLNLGVSDCAWCAQRGRRRADPGRDRARDTHAGPVGLRALRRARVLRRARARDRGRGRCAGGARRGRRGRWHLRAPGACAPTPVAGAGRVAVGIETPARSGHRGRAPRDEPTGYDLASDQRVTTATSATNRTGGSAGNHRAAVSSSARCRSAATSSA